MKQKFQAGDKVKFLDGEFKGKVGEVISYVTLPYLTRGCYWVSIGDRQTKVYSYQLEKYVEEAKPEFNVGDEVLYTFEYSEFKNRTGKILDVKKCTLATELITYEYSVLFGIKLVNCSEGYLKKVEDMNTERTVKLTLKKAKEWYKQGGELKEIALQAFTEKELKPLPRTWEEFCYNFPVDEKEKAVNAYGEPMIPDEYKHNNKRRCVSTSFSTLPNEKYVYAFAALMKLVSLRKAWVGDWKPNFKMNMAPNWTMEFHPTPGKWEVENHCWTSGGPLTFPTHDMCKEFFECFKDLYNEAIIIL